MPIAQYRHYGCRITDDLIYKGLRAIFLENDLLRVGVLLDKGADIFSFVHKPTDTDFLWRSPQGLINPQRFNATKASSAGAFLDNYHGGWQEIFPGGGPAIYQGAELGLHGEVDQLGWDFDILDDHPDHIAVRLQVDCVRTPFRLERTMRLEKGSPVLFMEETLTNLSPDSMDFMWGHHPAIGAPFLRKGVRIFVPAAEAEVHSPRFAASGIIEPGMQFNWPVATVHHQALDLSVVPDEDAGFAELIYLKNLSAGWYAVLDPDRKIGFGLSWPVDIFPYLWFWLVYGKAPGYPWWNRTYVVALEPWTSIPNDLSKAIEKGTQSKIKGGGQIKVSFSASVITGHDSVQMIEPDGKIH